MSSVHRRLLDKAMDAGQAFLLRGGSYNNNAINCRSANRNRNDPDHQNHNIGFRVVVAAR